MIERVFLQRIYQIGSPDADEIDAYPVGTALGLTRSQIRGVVDVGVRLGYLERRPGAMLPVRLTDRGRDYVRIGLASSTD